MCGAVDILQRSHSDLTVGSVSCGCCCMVGECQDESTCKQDGCGQVFWDSGMFRPKTENKLVPICFRAASLSLKGTAKHISPLLAATLPSTCCNLAASCSACACPRSCTACTARTVCTAQYARHAKHAWDSTAQHSVADAGKSRLVLHPLLRLFSLHAYGEICACQQRRQFENYECDFSLYLKDRTPTSSA